MENLIKGFIYELPNVGGSESQLLVFNKEGVDPHDGTTVVDVLKASLDKLRYDHEQKATRDTAIAVRYLEDALLRLEYGADREQS
jgi:hypothetical protein